MTKQYIKTTWFFFIILALAQTVRALIHLFAPGFYPHSIYLIYNFIFIVTVFALSYRIYQLSQSVLNAVSASILLLTISDVLVNVLVTLIAVKIYFPFEFTAALQQLHIAFKNGLMFLPMTVLLAFIACRIAHKRMLRS